ncbi:SCF E3 ubiquitin ligase [Limtongia smithiae]|uniref:SCF E3 ubiquitin ligase n=1 Tax=Limtongia smithiae TaxID=1125753 RepID=UPI0034CF1C24
MSASRLGDLLDDALVAAAASSSSSNPARFAAATSNRPAVLGIATQQPSRSGSVSPTDSSYTTPQPLSDSPDDIEDGDDDDGALDDYSPMAPSSKLDAAVLRRQQRPEGPAAHLPTEIVMLVLSYLESTADLKAAASVSKAWAQCAVEMLWYKPAVASGVVLDKFVRTLKHHDRTLFPYGSYVRKFTLAQVAECVSDQVLLDVAAACTDLERLSLTACTQLSDRSLAPTLEINTHLATLDLSSVSLLTDVAVLAIANNCPAVQVLSLAGCVQITDASMVSLARRLRGLRRLKLLDCAKLTNESVLAIAESCPLMLELDLQGCVLVDNAAVSAALTHLRALREFKIGFNPNVTDAAFASFPADGSLQFEALRVLDLTACDKITDASVRKIVDCAPKLRNLVLAKCFNITDRSISHIAKLGRSLHYLHLGHCNHITDAGVAHLVQHCTRIRYIDLGCCMQLTNAAVSDLATLPKLRRVGLVKCQNITDEAINALVQRRAFGLECSLERVHLSYCTSLTLAAIYDLLMACPRLTHLSLTGVAAFLHPELTQYCRPAPAEFNPHQRGVFCVFSGTGVTRLRNYLALLASDQQARFARLTQQMTAGAMHQNEVADAVMAGMAAPEAPLLHDGHPYFGPVHLFQPPGQPGIIPNPTLNNVVAAATAAAAHEVAQPLAYLPGQLLVNPFAPHIVHGAVPFTQQQQQQQQPVQAPVGGDADGDDMQQDITMDEDMGDTE